MLSLYVDAKSHTRTNTDMKSRLLVVSVLSLLILVSCGIPKQVISSSTSDSSKVQNTFFGASFGDSDETKVLKIMKTNGIGSMWGGKNGEIVFRHVYFAEQTWDIAMVSFADKQFCGINFCKRFDTKEEALEMLGKMNELLGKKYHLKKETFDGKYEDSYMYADAEGDYVFSSILFTENVESGQWTYTIGYRWHLAASIKEQAVLNEL